MSYFGKIRDNFSKAKNREGFSYLYTAVIGLGFFTTAITWSMYNVYMPLYLGELLGHLNRVGLIVGLIMVLDNIVAITPIFFIVFIPFQPFNLLGIHLEKCFPLLNICMKCKQ